ncbi:unnamed protein product [Prunus brigantina]
MFFFHRDSALHLEFSEPGYEILGRFILTLFEGSKVTDGDFWLNLVVIVVENTFHPFPSLDRISGYFETRGVEVFDRYKPGMASYR